MQDNRPDQSCRVRGGQIVAKGGGRRYKGSEKTLQAFGKQVRLVQCCEG